MRIVIPTFRRPNKQQTFEHLPKDWKGRVTFYADEQDTAALKRRSILQPYLGDVEFHVVPDGMTIAQKRAYIIKNPPERDILMLDDDLKFYRRKNETDVGLITINGRPDISVFFEEFETMFRDFVHVGIGMRQFNNNVKPNYGGWRLCSRMVYALGYNTEVVREVCELGRIEHREDMDYTLQLLSAGYQNAVSAHYCCGQGEFNAPGGASEERSMEASNADADRLAELHPGLVRVVEKDYKVSLKRKEVVVSWKRAYERSQRS